MASPEPESSHWHTLSGVAPGAHHGEERHACHSGNPKELGQRPHLVLGEVNSSLHGEVENLRDLQFPSSLMFNVSPSAPFSSCLYSKWQEEIRQPFNTLAGNLVAHELPVPSSIKLHVTQNLSRHTTKIHFLRASGHMFLTSLNALTGWLLMLHVSTNSLFKAV